VDRPLRADARRNRARVLAAAQEAFATEGLAVPLDEIARRAGVGAGTVYRHFPTKEALFEAVVADRLTRLAADARTALADEDPGAAFYGFLTVLLADAQRKKDLADALGEAELGTATLAVAAELQEELGRLLARAQQAGAVRADIGTADLHAITFGAMAAEGRGTGDGRLTAIILDCLRPR